MVRRVFIDSFYSDYATGILDVMFEYLEDNDFDVTESGRAALNLYLASKLAEMEDTKLEKATFYSIDETQYSLLVLNHSVSLPSITDDILAHCENNKENILIIDGLLFYGNTNQRFSKVKIDNDGSFKFEFIGKELDISKDPDLEKVYNQSLRHLNERKWLLTNSILSSQDKDAIINSTLKKDKLEDSLQQSLNEVKKIKSGKLEPLSLEDLWSVFEEE